MSDGRKTATSSNALTGVSSRTAFPERRLRGLLLGSVALTALMLVAPRGAYAQQNDNCVLSNGGATATCSPDANGDYILYPDGAVAPNTVNVQTSFTAATGYDAVSLTTTGDIAVINTTAGQTITVTGPQLNGSADVAFGLAGASSGSNGGVIINNNSTLNVSSTNSAATGASAIATGGGDATILSNGDITVNSGVTNGGPFSDDKYGFATGLYAGANQGTADITNNGNITVTGGTGFNGKPGTISRSTDGIVASGQTVNVTNYGGINATFVGESLFGGTTGINVAARGEDASATIVNEGGITLRGGKYGAGITAVTQNGDGGVVEVTNQGDISVGGEVGSGLKYGEGISADAGGVGGTVTVDNSGNIAIGAVANPATRGGNGISASAFDTVEIGNEGNITVFAGGSGIGGGPVPDGPGTRLVSGIAGNSKYGSVTVTNSGTVNVTALPAEVLTPALVAPGPDDPAAVSYPTSRGIQAVSLGGEEFNDGDQEETLSGGDVSITTAGDVTLNAGPQDTDGYANPETVNSALFVYSRAALNFGEESADDLEGADEPTAPAGTTNVFVNGADVTANGDFVHGVFASGSENTVQVANGGTVTANGANAYGIVVNPQVARTYSRTEEGNGKYTRTYSYAVASSVDNKVRVGQGSSVTSAQSAAIVDNETFTFRAGRYTYNENDLTLRAIDPGTLDPDVQDDSGIVTVSVPNDTTVEVAGTVVGGDGRAIVLNGGDDTVVLEPNFAITGTVDGGTNTQGPDGAPAAAENDLLALGGNSGSGTINFALVEIPGQGDAGKQFINFERFQKQGNSTFTVTGTNTGTFSLPVLDGTLLVNGNLANAALPVSSGATLGGTGTVGSLVANSGATIRPGTAAAPFGTLTTTGNATFRNGSTLGVNLNAAGQNNQLAVGGTTTIEGGTIAVNATPGAFTNQRYTVIDSAGAVSGRFDEVTDNLLDVDFTQTVNPNSVVLGLIGGGPASNKENGLASVFGAGNASMNFAETLGERARISNSPSGTAQPLAPLGYDAAPTSQTAALKAVHNADLVSPDVAPITNSPQIGFWLGGFGETTDVDDSSGALGYESNSGGVAGGFEYRSGGGGTDTIVGIAAGYSGSDVDAENGGADIDMGHVGIYGSYRNNALLLTGALSYGFYNTDLSRQLAFGGGQVTATAEADGDAVSGYAEASYDVAPGFGLAGLSIAPLARLRGVHAERDGYDESGAGILNLSVGDDDISQFFGGIGVRLGSEVTVGGAVLRPEIELVYEHNFADETQTSISTIPAANATFATSVFNGSDDRFSVGAGLGMDFNTNFSAHLRYDGTFAGDVDSHRGALGVTYKF